MVLDKKPKRTVGILISQRFRNNLHFWYAPSLLFLLLLNKFWFVQHQRTWQTLSLRVVSKNLFSPDRCKKGRILLNLKWMCCHAQSWVLRCKIHMQFNCDWCSYLACSTCRISCCSRVCWRDRCRNVWCKWSSPMCSQLEKWTPLKKLETHQYIDRYHLSQ